MSITRSIFGGRLRAGRDDEDVSFAPSGSRREADVDGRDARLRGVLSAPEPQIRGSSWKGYLEIRFDGNVVSQRLLTEPHLLIGRIAGVQVFLDHHTVSRRHAEMFCDPFGRWWIRDLGSTNGTLVNDVVVNDDQVLSPGDRISVGDFAINFHLEAPDSAHASARAAPVEYEKPAEIHTLLDFEPPRISAGHLRTLLELSRRLIAVEGREARLASLCELAVRSDFHAMTAVALRLGEGGATRISRTYHLGGLVGDDAPYVSRRVLRAVRETREPVLAGNSAPIGDSTSLELTMSREVMELGVIACPLAVDGGTIDLLYVTLPPHFSGPEWLSLFALAAEVYQQSESAWAARQHAQAHAAIERELQTARQIQRALLPRRLDFPGLDVAVGFEPCKWVGGDYVDVAELSDGRVLLAVADVCGKGLQAALVTSSLQTMVRASMDHTPTIAELMERVNRHLCEWLPAHSFVTMVVAAIDPATGDVECVNAGHPPVLIVDRHGDLRLLQSAENPALGVAPSRMELQRARLDLGDVLVMYTDGLTELRNAGLEMLGQERLGRDFSRICEDRRGAPSADMADALGKMLERFRGDRLPDDDRAFVVAQRSR
ncbi:Serine phosphatase RsbU, regulator of sigma subunit protein [Minicystis rosea]|nr:Serine phosphatase RsbU, regulator of sigma subunit protein [Minicystis rosea]